MPASSRPRPRAGPCSGAWWRSSTRHRAEALRDRTTRSADRASSGAPRALSEPDRRGAREARSADLGRRTRSRRRGSPPPRPTRRPGRHTRAREVGGSHLFSEARSGPPALAAVVCRRPARREPGTRFQDPSCAHRWGPRRAPLRRDLRSGAPTLRWSDLISERRPPVPGRRPSSSSAGPGCRSQRLRFVSRVQRETSVAQHRGWRGSRVPRNVPTRCSRSRRRAVPSTGSSHLGAASRSVRWNSGTSGPSRTPSV